MTTVQNIIKDNITQEVFTEYPTSSLLNNDNAFDVYVNSDDLVDEYIVCEAYEELTKEELQDVMNEKLEDLISLSIQLKPNKFFRVYNTDIWESRDSEIHNGVYSSFAKARETVKLITEPDQKTIIEELYLDEDDSGAKLVVYDFEYGSEYKNNDTLEELPELGDLAMAYLNSSYYEVTNFKLEKRFISTIIDCYMKWCEENKQELEIDYMEDDEFLELDQGIIDHVLYHAEMICHPDLDELFKELNR